MENMDNTHETHDHEEATKFFNEQQALMKEIYEKGFQSYVESLVNLHNAFAETAKSVSCMDEGTPEGCFCNAGSGILVEDEEEFLKYCRKAGITEVTSHDGCGAAGLYAKAHGLDPSEADKCGIEFSKKIAEKLGVTYRHINSEDMHRPENQHIARAVYFDTTSKFNYSKVNGLPVGFKVSPEIESFENCIKDITIAFNIATGDHGFGELITGENPFIVCVIANNKNEFENLQSELSKLTKTFGKKVKIDGFIAPEIK